MSKKQTKESEQQVVTAEDAERMFAQAWPAKRQAVGQEVQAALDAIGAKYGVTIQAQLAVLPAFLAQPTQGNLPPRP